MVAPDLTHYRRRKVADLGLSVVSLLEDDLHTEHKNCAVHNDTEACCTANTVRWKQTNLLSCLARGSWVSSWACTAFGSLGAIFSSWANLAHLALKCKVIWFVHLKYFHTWRWRFQSIRESGFCDSWFLVS